jgi:UDP-N-acetyl-2-amino-2-deoxyglucuronate dehydrogenase
MKKLNLGMVGCGDIGGFTALASKLVPRVRLAACCDVNYNRAQIFAHRHRIAHVYQDYAEMLAKAGLDAVYLAVPHNLHYEMILTAVEAGIPVLVEKPVTRTLEEGKNLVARIANQKVGVNYQYRYDSGCYALGRAVQAGTLGRIHSIRINIPWHRTQSYFNEAPWHKTFAQAGGGTLITQGSHFLDVALWALGENPVSAMGYTGSPGFDVDVDTLAHGIVETSGGTLLNIASSMVAASEQVVTVEVYGERGTGIYRDLPLPSLKFVGIKVRTERPPEWGVHALQRSLAGFTSWVLDDKPYLIPVHTALPVLAAVDGIYRSAHSGKREVIGY